MIHEFILSSRGAVAVAALLGFALLTVPAYAGIDVEKSITGIDADNDGSFEITDSGAIATFLEDVPSGTIINFRVEVTVSSTDGQDLDNVVVTDKFGSELDITCDTFPVGTTCQIAGGGRRLRWIVGALGTGSETLIVIATTNEDPGGHQRYTECGQHEFNSGPTAKGTEEVQLNPQKKKNQQRSDDGDQILLTVSGAAFPQCSNCQDDDGDGFIDFPADLGCTDADDNDELPVNF